MYLYTPWFGTFLIDKNKVYRYKLFPKNARSIADRLARIENDEILDEEKELVKGIDEFYVKEKRLVLSKKQVEIDPAHYGFSYKLLHATLIDLGKRKLATIPKEAEIVQTVNTLNDLYKTINLLSERKKELSIKSLSARISQLVGDVEKTKESVEENLEKSTRRVAPNLSAVGGYSITAALIAAAGSLQKLALMPASRLQTLGAERALFRALREGKKPPKHGIIYQHPWVRGAPKKDRGKRARMLANKLCIAARADWGTGRFIGKKLKAELKQYFTAKNR